MNVKELKDYLSYHLFDEEKMSLVFTEKENGLCIEMNVIDPSVCKTLKTTPITLYLNEEHVIYLIDHPYKYITFGNKEFILHLTHLLGQQIILD